MQTQTPTPQENSNSGQSADDYNTGSDQADGAPTLRLQSWSRRMIRALNLSLVLAVTALAQAPQPDAAANTPQVSKPRRPHIFLTLARPVAAMDFDEANFEDVVNWIRDMTGTNVVVNWNALATVGVERNTPVTLKIKDVTLSRALWLIMQTAGGADAKLAYSADPDMIYISTLEDLSAKMVVKVYDVQDLIMNIPTRANFEAVRNQQVVTSNGNNGVRVIENVQSGVRFNDEGDASRNDDQEADTTNTMRQLMNVITGTIDPDSWDVNGGPGVIRAFHGQIIVRNSPFVHQKLAGYLTKP